MPNQQPPVALVAIDAIDAIDASKRVKPSNLQSPAQPKCKAARSVRWATCLA